MSPRVNRSGRELRRASLRIAAMAAGLLVAVLAVVAVLVIIVVLDGQRQQTIATLNEAIASSHGGGPTGTHHDGDDSAIRNVAVAVVDHDGFHVDGTMPKGLPDRAVMREVTQSGDVDQRQLTIAGRHYAVRTAQHGDDTVQAVLDLHEQYAEITRLVQAIVFGGAIGVVLAAGAAMLLGRRAVRPLADALQLQQRFVADAAHELRTPLTLLSTRAQLLGRRFRTVEVKPELRADLETGVRGLVGDAANLTEILEDLLVAADRTIELPQQPVDLTAVARDAVTAAASAATAAGIDLRLTTTGDESTATIAAGSRAALLRAANALIDNAVGHARSTVEVAVIASSAAIELRVTDDGPGIDRQLLPRMFDRFASQRSADESAGERRHYGLGLALVSDVAARHFGSVSAGSRTDGRQGAVFTLQLPTKIKQ